MARVKTNFVRFLVQTRPRKMASEIYWPLKSRQKIDAQNIEEDDNLKNLIYVE